MSRSKRQKLKPVPDRPRRFFSITAAMSKAVEEPVATTSSKQAVKRKITEVEADDYENQENSGPMPIVKLEV